MGKKMKLPFLSQNTDSSSSTSWPWPSCSQTRTLSFRANDNIFKTMNSTFSETTSTKNDDNDEETAIPATSASETTVDPVEAMIRGLTRGSSERLFFEPGETSSILDENKLATNEDEDQNNVVSVPFKESVALSLDSRNPSLDFKKSMEEMVEAHGIKAWEGLEELLCCYLKINGKDNHGYIVGAFVDLLLGLAFDDNNINIYNNNNDNKNRCFNCDSPYSPLSFCNTSSSSSSSSSSISSSSNYCVSSFALGLAVSDDLEFETSCNLSSLLETTEEEDDDDVSS